MIGQTLHGATRMKTSYVEVPRYPGNPNRQVVIHWKETVTYEAVVDVDTSAAIAVWLNEHLDKTPFDAVRSLVEQEEIDLCELGHVEVIDTEDREVHDVYTIEG